MCVGHGRYRIRDAGTCRDDSHPGFTTDSGPTVCGVRSGLFMSYVDNSDFLIDAAIINRLHMPSTKGKDVAHAFGLESPRHNMTTGDIRTHLYIPFLFQCYAPRRVPPLGETAIVRTVWIRVHG
jgi:hypothetical protein